MGFCIICGKQSDKLSQKGRDPQCQKKKGTATYNTYTGRRIN